MDRSSPDDFFWELQPKLIAISAIRIEKNVFFIYTLSYAFQLYHKFLFLPFYQVNLLRIIRISWYTYLGVDYFLQHIYVKIS